MRRIVSVAIGVLLSTTIGGGLLSESQAAYKQGLQDNSTKIKMNQRGGSPTPSPTPSPTRRPRR